MTCKSGDKNLEEFVQRKCKNARKLERDEKTTRKSWENNLEDFIKNFEDFIKKTWKRWENNWEELRKKLKRVDKITWMSSRGTWKSWENTRKSKTRFKSLNKFGSRYFRGTIFGETL